MKPIVKIMGSMAVMLGMFIPMQAGAKTLYGTANGGADFITIESTTGVATFVTAFNPAGWALEFTPDGTLWAIALGDAQLYTVDAVTGLTAVGTPGVNPSFSQLASDGNGNLYATCDSNDSLYSIDKVTGQATAIGSTGIGTLDVAISFNKAGTLYGADGTGLTLNTINPATGVATNIAPITGIAVNFIGLAIDQETGSAYLTDYTVPGSLYTLDLATGVATQVGPTGMNLHFDLAIPWPIAAAAPADNGCGWLIPVGKQSLWVLAILPLMIAGIVLVRRRA